MLQYVSVRYVNAEYVNVYVILWYMLSPHSFLCQLLSQFFFRLLPTLHTLPHTQLSLSPSLHFPPSLALTLQSFLSLSVSLLY